MYSASITLKGVDSDMLSRALGPELESGFNRAKIDLERSSDGLTLELKADDVNALRAAINSYLRWLKIIEELKDEVSDKIGSEASDS